MTFVRCFVSWTWCHGWCALARGAGGMKDGGDTFLPRHPFLPQRAARSTSRCSDLLIVGPSLRFTVLGPPFHFTVLRGPPYTLLCLVVFPLHCVSSCSLPWYTASAASISRRKTVCGFFSRCPNVLASLFREPPALAPPFPCTSLSYIEITKLEKASATPSPVCRGGWGAHVSTC